ncbi:hypothetical protein [Halopseudomonas salegens]|uniref:Uncharacterized protein n=1 Tax=Halopseudomonas salegens TaxID=1434072 RepID=A0A1H2FG98_9GAMM|nr:hypothetical protein [Halopseudomonas salegens]SDU06319.1 hypothetical protein SAMN05216210_1533 [Halopseudomonas salegens]
MPEILLPSYPLGARETDLMCADPRITLRDGLNRQPLRLNANTPYLMTDTVRPGDMDILGTLAATNASRDLTELTSVLTSEGVEILAGFHENMVSAGTAGAGPAAAVYGGRMTQLSEHLAAYEKALLEYRAAARSGSPLMVAKRQEATRAFERLQRGFQNEISAITADIKARRGTALTRLERGLNIARSSRNTNSLQIRNQAHAHQLVRFSQHAKLFGDKLAIIDFGSRIGHIHTEHMAGGDWHREMFKQSLSFAASAGTATAVVKFGLAGLGALMLITPLGPIILVGAGIAIAGTAAYAAMKADDIFLNNSGGWYDQLMEKLQ